jgi:peroxiredoxin
VELRLGVALPDWSFSDLKGNKGTLKAYAGKYVLLDVWTPSCAPCLAEFEALKSVLQSFQSRDFEILGVLCDKDETGARTVAEQRNLTCLGLRLLHRQHSITP